MARTTEDITANEWGEDVHPSFGWANVNRHSFGPPGTHLFDSEIRHSEAVVLRIGRATRKRDLNHDWVHEDGMAPLVEVKMSMAQWGALVSSFGTSGVPCTLTTLDHQDVPSAPYSSRLAISMAETEAAAHKSVETIVEAAEALRAAHERKAGRKEVGDLLRDLEIRLSNNAPNVTFAADSLTKHVENVVTKARADIEAMVAMAADHQLETGSVAGLLGPAPIDTEESTT